VNCFAVTNFFTFAGPPSSMDTPSTTTPRSEYFSWMACSSGMDFRHGTHHVAQKSTSTTLPLRLWFDTGLRERVSSANEGAGRGNVGGK